MFYKEEIYIYKYRVGEVQGYIKYIFSISVKIL